MKQLSSYQLKCGYVQEHVINLNYLYYIKVEIYHEHSVYHVRAFNFVKGSSVSDRLEWKNYHTLKEARKRFKELIKIYSPEKLK